MTTWVHLTSVVKTWALLLDTGIFTGVMARYRSAYLWAVLVSFPSPVPQQHGWLLKRRGVQPGGLSKTNVFFCSRQTAVALGQLPWSSWALPAAGWGFQQKGREGGPTAGGESPDSCPQRNSPHSRKGPLTGGVFWFSCHRTMEPECKDADFNCF